MNQNSNILTGILSITQKGGMRLLRGANNATTPLSELAQLPTLWMHAAIQKTKEKKKQYNNMPNTQTVVTVFKHVENFSPSDSSLRELHPGFKVEKGMKFIKGKPSFFTEQERLEAFILDCVYDAFQSTRGVSYKFQTSDGTFSIVKSF